jgi:hypothetical protein
MICSNRFRRCKTVFAVMSRPALKADRTSNRLPERSDVSAIVAAAETWVRLPNSAPRSHRPGWLIAGSVDLLLLRLLETSAQAVSDCGTKSELFLWN